jgi:hypothetical protein
MKNKTEILTCEKCTGVQKIENFYKPLEKNKICKDCLYKEFIFQYSGIYDCDFGVTIDWMCKEYDLPFVDQLIYYHKEIENIKDKLECYINDISLLPMYQNSNDVKEEPDIDFINDDIKQLKVKILKTLEKDDFNAHNKWMNSLRDAIDLRDKLRGNKDTTINIGTIMVKDDTDINKLSEELSKLTKRDKLY